MPKDANAPFHPRNKHQGRYDFARLIASSPALREFVAKNRYGDASIDFSDPKAVKALNAALLRDQYGIVDWDVPEGFLCPPIPGRADLIHYAADLIDGRRGESVRVLDIGVGANAIYPIVGRVDYGWSFVGTDIDPVAVESARKIVHANGALKGGIEIRLQAKPQNIFNGVIHDGERFDLVVCNPPFHASQADAEDAARKKWAGLGKAPAERPALNFGGSASELWCDGGETGFVRRLIGESEAYKNRVGWFTALLSRSSSVEELVRVLERLKARVRVVPMTQGQKTSRILAWQW